MIKIDPKNVYRVICNNSDEWDKLMKFLEDHEIEYKWATSGNPTNKKYDSKYKVCVINRAVDYKSRLYVSETINVDNNMTINLSNIITYNELEYIRTIIYKD